MAAGIVVYRNNAGKREYLLLKRKEGWLDLPKGHIEEKEDEYEAAKRETREETGLEVHPHRFFRYVAEYSYEDNGKTINKKVIFFIGKSGGSNAVSSSEHVGVEWLSVEELLVKLTHDNDNSKLNVIDVLKAADSYIEKLEMLHKINKEHAKLPQLHDGWNLSRTFVPGEGSLSATVMFIGQAPGKNEDIERRPFIGMAGKLLDQLIHLAGMKRKDVYISNIVHFFPPGNRLPTEEEAALEMPYLLKEIEIIKPKILVLLGSFSAMNVAGIGQVMKNHGTHKYMEKYGCEVFITLHPAAAVRIKANVPIMEKDFNKLKQLISSDSDRQKLL